MRWGNGEMEVKELEEWVGRWSQTEINFERQTNFQIERELWDYLSELWDYLSEL